MCASHLIEMHFTRYCFLICRGRSEKGQGISERCDCIVRKEEERDRKRQKGRGQLMYRGVSYPLLAYHTPQNLGE